MWSMSSILAQPQQDWFEVGLAQHVLVCLLETANPNVVLKL